MTFVAGTSQTPGGTLRRSEVLRVLDYEYDEVSKDFTAVLASL